MKAQYRRRTLLSVIEEPTIAIPDELERTFRTHHGLVFRTAYRITGRRQVNSSDVAEITLMSPGDILFLYTDGVYDGSDDEERSQLERVMRNHKDHPAREICNALLEYAVKRDEHLEQIGEDDVIDDKTVFIIKRR